MKLALYIITFLLILLFIKKKKENNLLEHFNVYDIIDSRINFLDHNQESTSINEIIKKFDKSNVVGAMITGMPVIWNEERNKFFWYEETDAFLAEMLFFQPLEIKNKFYPFISCVYDSPKSLKHVKNMIKTFPDFWRGIGPIFMSHKNKNDNFIDGKNLYRIINIASKNHIPIHIYYQFNDIEMDMEDVYDYLDKLGYMEMEDREINIFDILERYPNAKFILYFNTYMPITNAESINKIIDSLLTRYPNLTIDLSGKLLENIYMNKEQQIEQQNIEKRFKLQDIPGPQVPRSIRNFFSQINSIEDIAKIALGLVDDFLSGDPLKENEKGEMKAAKDLKKGVDFVDNALDKLGDNLKDIDPAKIATNFLEPEERDMSAIENELKQLANSAILNRYESKRLRDLEEEKYLKDIDLVPKRRINQDWDLQRPSQPISRDRIPEELTDQQRNEIRKRSGSDLVDAIDNQDSGNIESRIKGKSTGALLPVIAFEDDFRYLEGFSIFGDTKDLIKDTAIDSVTLPKEIKGPLPPLTEKDLEKNKNIIPKIEFSDKAKKLGKKVNNYIDSGEFKKDAEEGTKRLIKKGYQNLFGLDELGRTIYEVPQKGRDGRVYYITNVVTIGEDKYVDVIDIITRKKRRYYKDLDELFPGLKTPGLDEDLLEDDSLDKIYENQLDEEYKKDSKDNKLDYTKKQFSSFFGIKDEELERRINKNKNQFKKFEQIRKDWIQLIEKYPKQFIIGTGNIGKLDNYNKKVLLCNYLLGDLTPNTARNVSRFNFINLVNY